MPQLKLNRATLRALVAVVLLPGVLLFARETMTTGHASPNHVLGTMLVAAGLAALALALIHARKSGTASLPYVVAGLACLLSGFAMVDAVRPQLQHPFRYVSGLLVIGYCLWNIRRRLARHS